MPPLDTRTLAENWWRASPARFGQHFGTKRGDYVSRPHLELFSQEIVGALSGPRKRKIFNVRRRAGKSELCSVITPAWYLDLFPGRTVIVASVEATLATSFGRDARNLVQRHENVLDVTLDPDVQAAREWNTTAGGGMLARGVGGSLIGRGAGLCVIDDLYADFEQAHSKLWRDKVWQWWISVIEPLLDPDAVVLVPQTRWHEDDFVGRLLSGEHEGDPADWDVICLPALAEPADDTPDPLGRAEGEPIVRPNETPEEAAAFLERQRATGSAYLWNGMFQQRPSEPTGTIFKRGWWQYWKLGELKGLEPDTVWFSWDCAFKDTKDSSFVVGQCWVSKGPDRWLFDQVRGRWGFNATCEQIERFVARCREQWPLANAVVIEEKANGPAIIDALRRKVAGIVPFNPDKFGSKAARATSVAPLVEAGNVHIPAHSDRRPWVREFVQECADFDSGAHDDQVDAMTQALIWRDQRPRKHAKTRVVA